MTTKILSQKIAKASPRIDYIKSNPKLKLFTVNPALRRSEKMIKNVKEYASPPVTVTHNGHTVTLTKLTTAEYEVFSKWDNLSEEQKNMYLNKFSNEVEMRLNKMCGTAKFLLQQEMRNSNENK
jgi:hypothetical protein